MFYVYVLRCVDGSLYAGYTNNISKRVIMHRQGKASKYTRSRLPIELVAKWPFRTKSEAMRHEIKFKSLPRKAKISAITSSQQNRCPFLSSSQEIFPFSTQTGSRKHIR